MFFRRILPIIALIVSVALPTAVSAQVPVEVSDEKVVTDGRVFYMHEVQKNQTLYSISRAYRVSIDAITRENVIPPNGIQTGQILRIPGSGQQAVPTAQPRPAVQQPAAPAQSRPAASPSRSQGSLADVQMSDGTWIRIADEKIVSGGRTYYMHRIEKGQTLYSIAKAYKVTILDIDRENSIPPGGIREGQVLKIPAATALTVIEERDIPDQASARPERSEAAGAGREVTAEGTVVPRQETQLPHQETQLPRQEQPAAKPDEAATKDNMADKPAEAEKKAEVKPAAKVKTQPESRQQAETQQQTPVTSQSQEKPKPVQPVKKKVHKVQKGESLSDIAKKYGITVQELKQANKGVIFAMPDMRLVIPVREEE